MHFSNIYLSYYAHYMHFSHFTYRHMLIICIFTFLYIVGNMYMLCIFQILFMLRYDMRYFNSFIFYLQVCKKVRLKNLALLCEYIFEIINSRYI